MNLFDNTFNGMPGVEMYRSWVHPDTQPNHPKALVNNWSQQDREMYCGAA